MCGEISKVEESGRGFRTAWEDWEEQEGGWGGLGKVECVEGCTELMRFRQGCKGVCRGNESLSSRMR